MDKIVRALIQRLVISYLMEDTGYWANDWAYIKANKFAAVLENRITQVAN